MASSAFFHSTRHELLKVAMGRLSSEANEYRGRMYREGLHDTELGAERIAETDAELEMIAGILQKLRP